MTRRALPFYCSVLLVALVLASYWPVRSNGFVDFDDHEYIVDNPVVSNGLSWHGIRWAFTTTHTGNWHPVTWLSHMVDGELFGREHPAAHHWHSVALHAASAVLLFYVLWRMTGAAGPSFFVACVFAVHPLQVESVAWAAERKSTLSMLFWMLTLLAYVRYAERPRLGRYLAVVVAFALGLMSKPAVVTLPFVLLLLDYWPLGRLRRRSEEDNTEPSTNRGHSFGRLVLEKAPLFALAAAACVVTLYVQQAAGLVKSGPDRPLATRLENASVSYAFYISKMFWPADLAVFYPYAGRALPAWKLIASALLLGAVSLGVAAAVYYRRWPYLAVGWLWYLGTLVPMIGLIQPGLHAATDRYTYIPLIGLEIALAWLATAVTVHLPYRRVALALVGTCIVLGLHAATFHQVQLWRDSITLFEHTIEVTQRNDVARYNLAIVLERQGRPSEAIERYREAVEINPAYISARLNLGTALARQRRYDEAAQEFERLLEQKPDDAMAHHNLANVLVELGKTAEAAEHYREAMRLRPEWPQPAVGLTWILAAAPDADLRDADEAVRLGRQSCNALRRQQRATPAELAGALDALGAAYAEAKRFSEAAAAANEAIRTALAAGNPQLAGEISRQRLRLYENRQAYRLSRATNDRTKRDPSSTPVPADGATENRTASP